MRFKTWFTVLRRKLPDLHNYEINKKIPFAPAVCYVPFLLPKPGLKVLPAIIISGTKRRIGKIKTDLKTSEKIDAIWNLIHGSTTKITWFT